MHSTPTSRHCEERSDEAIQTAGQKALDCFASLAMTVVGLPDRRRILFAVKDEE
jgi:hypothetical protein